jgi:hypothetical protein
VLLFHPFLLRVGSEAVSVLDELLARVAELGRAGDLRCVRMDEAAVALPADAGEPELDTTTSDA